MGTKTYGLLALLCGGLLQGQIVLPARVNCLAPDQPQTITLHFTSENVAVPGSPGLHWKISPLPTASDINFTDPNLKSAVLAWLSGPQQAAHPWIMDGRNSWTFFNSGLGPGISEAFKINPYSLVLSPSASGLTDTRAVTFCAAPAPALHLNSLEIEMFSASYDPAVQTGPQPLHANLEPGVTASAYLSPEESQNPGPLLDALAKVAETAWGIAKKNQIALGGEPTGATLSKAEAAVNTFYNMAQGNIPSQFWEQWPQPHAVFQQTKTGQCCTLRITKVRMATSATLRVEAKIADVKSLTSRQQQRADMLAERSRQALEKRFQAALAGFTNTVPSFPQINALRSSLSASPEILPDVRLELSKANEGREQVIVFDTDNRWTRLMVDLTAGGGYSTENKGTGSITFSGENLLTNIPESLSPKETESANYTGGGEVQNGSANWGLNWTRNLQSGAQINYGPQVSGDFHQDQNQRFGNVTGPLLRDHEIGWQPGFSYTYTPSQMTDSGLRKHLLSLTASAGLRQRWFRITPAQGDGFRPRGNGAVTLVFLGAAPAYRYQPVNSSRIGGFELSADAHLLRSLPPSDFTFTQVQASIKATLFFGGSFPNDYFVRFRKGMGVSTGATPLFELFRLGGTDNTRGLEQGEQIGRQISFEQYEAGISARQIVSWFQPRPKAAKPDETPNMSPLDLSKIYLKVFLDRGRVAQNLGFGDLFSVQHAAKGYGFAVEIASISAGNRRLSLSIGYARSPDSALHSRGVPITSASLDF